jgi:hypothetical protein
MRKTTSSVREKNLVLSEWEKPRPQWVRKTTFSVSEKNLVLSEWEKPRPQWVRKTTFSVSEKNLVLSEWEKPRPQGVKKTTSSGRDKNHVLSAWNRDLIRTSVDVCGHKNSVFLAACVIEINAKVNIMLFRTLYSTEFQAPCSAGLNLGQPQNCIYGIYGP